MKTKASSIDRLLQAVATVPTGTRAGDAVSVSIPASSRSGGKPGRSIPAAIAHLLRRVMLLIAVTFIVLASAGAYREFLRWR